MANNKKHPLFNKVVGICGGLIMGLGVSAAIAANDAGGNAADFSAAKGKIEISSLAVSDTVLPPTLLQSVNSNVASSGAVIKHGEFGCKQNANSGATINDLTASLPEAGQIFVKDVAMDIYKQLVAAKALGDKDFRSVVSDNFDVAHQGYAGNARSTVAEPSHVKSFKVLSAIPDEAALDRIKADSASGKINTFANDASVFGNSVLKSSWDEIKNANNFYENSVKTTETNIKLFGIWENRALLSIDTVRGVGDDFMNKSPNEALKVLTGEIIKRMPSYGFDEKTTTEYIEKSGITNPLPPTALLSSAEQEKASARIELVRGLYGAKPKCGVKFS